MLKRNRIFSVISIVLLISIGYVRDTIFVSINQQLAYRLYENTEFRVQSWMSFIEPLGYWETYLLKWVAVFAFCLAYLLATHLSLKLLFNESYFRVVLLSYGSLLLLSGLIFGFFWLLGDAQKGYDIGRYPLSWAQSPIPFMIFVPAIFLRKSSLSA